MRCILAALLLLSLNAAAGERDAIAAAIDWAEQRVGSERPSPAPGSPLVIAHRGASGEAPEHTLEAYALAVLQGADYIEADLVMTADGALIARHENELNLTTDVAEHDAFADRQRRRLVDRNYRRGWFTEDFSLAEIRQLRAVERMPALRPGNTALHGRVVTLQEIIDLARRLETLEGRPVGLYLETKHPRHFARRGLPMEASLTQVLHANGYDSATAPVYLQSFEKTSLERLRELTSLRLVQLIGRRRAADQGWLLGLSFRRMASAEGLLAVARYADAVGPEKGYVIARDAAGNLGSPSDLVANARSAGLAVHPYTFRAENRFLPTDLRSSERDADLGDLERELAAFIAAGVDGLFIDHPAVAVQMLQQRAPTRAALLSSALNRNRDIE